MNTRQATQWTLLVFNSRRYQQIIDVKIKLIALVVFEITPGCRTNSSQLFHVYGQSLNCGMKISGQRPVREVLYQLWSWLTKHVRLAHHKRTAVSKHKTESGWRTLTRC